MTPMCPTEQHVGYCKNYHFTFCFAWTVSGSQGARRAAARLRSTVLPRAARGSILRAPQGLVNGKSEVFRDFFPWGPGGQRIGGVRGQIPRLRGLAAALLGMTQSRTVLKPGGSRALATTNRRAAGIMPAAPQSGIYQRRSSATRPKCPCSDRLHAG